MERLTSFEEFWPFYVAQHSRASTRAWHFAGTTLVLATLAVAFVVSPRWALAAPFVGYGPAWIGHFFFEKNRPATFTYPWWSLRGDFRMYRLMLTGRMAPEVARARQVHR
ncbi:MAG TPA: DUF962 domain-containing protein [Vicinamibacteria bacterium]|nr:DUF962 domain-containing protein [Vicinamibacteria bacterium]